MRQQEQTTRGATQLNDWWQARTALIEAVHEGQEPGDVVGQLLREEVIRDGVAPSHRRHSPQVSHQPVEGCRNCRALRSGIIAVNTDVLSEYFCVLQRSRYLLRQ